MSRKIPFKDRALHAATYQVEKIIDQLKLRGINWPEEEIQDRVIIALFGHNFTDKVIKQIEKCPVYYSDMTLAQKYGIAGWQKWESDTIGNRETSRATLDAICKGSIKEKVAAAKEEKEVLQRIQPKISQAQERVQPKRGGVEKSER